MIFMDLKYAFASTTEHDLNHQLCLEKNALKRTYA